MVVAASGPPLRPPGGGASGDSRDIKAFLWNLLSCFFFTFLVLFARDARFRHAEAPPVFAAGRRAKVRKAGAERARDCTQGCLYCLFIISGGTTCLTLPV